MITARKFEEKRTGGSGPTEPKTKSFFRFDRFPRDVFCQVSDLLSDRDLFSSFSAVSHSSSTLVDTLPNYFFQQRFRKSRYSIFRDDLAFPLTKKHYRGVRRAASWGHPRVFTRPELALIGGDIPMLVALAKKISVGRMIVEPFPPLFIFAMGGNLNPRSIEILANAHIDFRVIDSGYNNIEKLLALMGLLTCVLIPALKKAGVDFRFIAHISEIIGMKHGYGFHHFLAERGLLTPALVPALKDAGVDFSITLEGDYYPGFHRFLEARNRLTPALVPVLKKAGVNFQSAPSNGGCGIQHSLALNRRLSPALVLALKMAGVKFRGDFVLSVLVRNRALTRELIEALRNAGVNFAVKDKYGEDIRNWCKGGTDDFIRLCEEAYLIDSKPKNKAKTKALSQSAASPAMPPYIATPSGNA